MHASCEVINYFAHNSYHRVKSASPTVRAGLATADPLRNPYCTDNHLRQRNGARRCNRELYQQRPCFAMHTNSESGTVNLGFGVIGPVPVLL
jgi:hypothetical protein